MGRDGSGVAAFGVGGSLERCGGPAVRVCARVVRRRGGAPELVAAVDGSQPSGAACCPGRERCKSRGRDCLDRGAMLAVPGCARPRRGAGAASVRGCADVRSAGLGDRTRASQPRRGVRGGRCLGSEDERHATAATGGGGVGGDRVSRAPALGTPRALGRGDALVGDTAARGRFGGVFPGSALEARTVALQGTAACTGGRAIVDRAVGPCDG